MRNPREVMQSYHARECCIQFRDETERWLGQGGSLQAKVEELGMGPLSGLLYSYDEIQALHLVDEEVHLCLQRGESGGILKVEWRTGEAWTEPVDLAPSEWLEFPLGGQAFRPSPGQPQASLRDALRDLQSPLYAVTGSKGLSWYQRGELRHGRDGRPLLAWLPPSQALGPEWFRRRHQLQSNYMVGPMGWGISSIPMLQALGEARLMGFFGVDGLPLEEVQRTLRSSKGTLQELPHGFSLTHQPQNSRREEALVDAYLEHGCQALCVQGFTRPTLNLLRYRFKGIHRDSDGVIQVPNKLLLKIEEPKLAESFLYPASETLIWKLVSKGQLSSDQAELAMRVPIASSLIANGNSLTGELLIPILRQLRDSAEEAMSYPESLRVGLGLSGGIGTPASVLSAFTQGADFIMTGSINQSCLEARTSVSVKEMLAEARLGDTTPAPSLHGFEHGRQVQVLGASSLFSQRAQQLWEVYQQYPEWDMVPPKDRARLERNILWRSFPDIWAECKEYWGRENPERLRRAELDGRQQMALVFRWYLMRSVDWALSGDDRRRRDYQVWCNPVMGAFNHWVQGSELEVLSGRKVVLIAEALMQGARVLERINALRSQGVELPRHAERWSKP